LIALRGDTNGGRESDAIACKRGLRRATNSVDDGRALVQAAR
jgi:hypothetical protein